MISIVVPVYNEEKTVKELHRLITKTMRQQYSSYEIIFIDDGSTDNTWREISKLQPIKSISLQKNYGQTCALDVGIQEAKGDIIVLLDADLQNDPKDILQFIKKLNDGCDAVIGWRKKRHDPWTRLFFSRVANAFARLFFGIKIHDFGCGLKVYRSKFIKNYRLWGEAQVFLPAVAKERGAKICELMINHYPRKEGKSKIKITRLVKGIFDLLSVVFFVKYFARPLRFFGGLGGLSIFLSILIFGIAIPLVGTLFAILGVILIMMGFLAETLLRIYYEVAKSSPYVIKEIKENVKKV